MSILSAVLRICIIVGMVESGIKLGLPLLAGESQAMTAHEHRMFALLDILILLLVAGPLVYYFMVRPFEQARERAESILIDAIENIADGFMMYDADDRIVLCNERYRTMFEKIADVLVPGTSFEDQLQIGVARGQYPEAIGREEEFIADRVACHRHPGEPIIRQRGDGRWYIIQEAQTPDGGLFAISIDITDVKKAEAEIPAKEQRIRGILESVPDGVITIDASGIVRTFNSAAEAMFGYWADEVIGQNVKILMPDPYAREHDQHLKSYLETGKRKVIGLGAGEAVALRKDGTTFPLELRLGEIRADDTPIRRCSAGYQPSEGCGAGKGADGNAHSRVAENGESRHARGRHRA